MHAPRRRILLALVALALAACGDDGGDGAGATTTTAPAPAPLPDACDLVPDAAAASGLALGAPVADGNDERRVCAFSAVEEGQVGLTVAVQGGGRFDEKRQQSEASLGEAEEVDGIGDRAVFVYDDEDLPEGVGGLLVGVGDLTIEVTLQGLVEDDMREAATALGELAVSNL